MTVLSHLRLGAALVLFCLGCKKDEPQGTVLAQVDQARLTLEDVRESFPAEFEKILPREQYLDFIQRWVDDEIAYQQALKGKLDEDPKVRKRLEKMRRKIILEEFLAREGLGEDYEPDEGAMTRYYEMHTEFFRRQTPEFRYAAIRTGSMKDAMARAKSKDDPFAASGSEGAVEMPSAVLFRKPSEIPACLLEKIANARPGILRDPIRCPDGVYLVKLLERVEAGTLIAYSEAKDAIRGQLALEHRDRMREARIRKYKEGMAVSLELERVPGRESAALAASDAANMMPAAPEAEPAPDRLPAAKAPKPRKPRKPAAPKPAPATSEAAPAAAEAPSSEGTSHVPPSP